MVYTIKVTNGGITFTNGSLDMVGTKNKIDKDEKIQSVGLRFLTQKGENNWSPDEGFDYEGILEQFTTVVPEDIKITKEQIAGVNAIKCLAQDKQISRFIDKLEIIKKEAEEELIINLTFHTIEGEQLEGKFRFGRDLIV